jgi:thioredoxin-related protein
MTDVKAALEKAQKQVKAKEGTGLVVVVVTAGQCGYCDQLDEQLFSHKNVVTAAERFAFVHEKVGGDEFGAVHDSAFAKKHKTDFTPTFYVLDESGDVIDKFAGLPRPKEFVALLKQIEQDHEAFPKLEARVKKNPEDHDALGRYAAALAARNRVGDAVALVEKAEGEKGEPIAALAPAYNRIGDTHYEAVFRAMCELYGSFAVYDRRSTEAARWFRRTVESSKDPEHLAYARYGLATCAGAQGQKDERVKILKEILGMPDAPELMKSRIEWLLELKRPDGEKRKSK